MSIVDTEKVLVVPTSLFHSLGYFQGFSTDVDLYLDQLLGSNEIAYRPRSEMESDESFKQLIPYCVFRHTAPDGKVSLFRYTRGASGGESRLKSKLSVGVGGHISSEDAALSGDVYANGLARELAEEVRIETPFTERLAGLINDDETSVGRVHLGVVHLFDVDSPDVFPHEDGIAEAGFATLNQLRHEFDRMETWSQITLRALFAIN